MATKVLEVADASERLGWLQALRGIAAVSVVICHCNLNLAGPSYEAVIDILNRLGAGVDLFFVISGFIIVHTTRDDPGGVRSAAGFAIKRLRRIWPAYVALTIVVGLLTFGWGLILDDDTRTRLVKSVLFVPASYDSIYGSQIIVQGWTLGFEIYFYAVFATSLLFASWRWTFLAAWWGVTLIILPLIYHASLTDVFQSYATTDYPLNYLKLATNPVIWEFVAGGVAALIYQSSVRIRSEQLCSALALGSVAFALWNTLSPMVPSALGVALGYAIMIAAISVASKTIDISAPWALRYLGDISYTLYLEHLAVIYILKSVYTFIGLQDEWTTLGNVPVTVFACILVAALTSRFLERDLLRWTWSAFRPRSRSYPELSKSSA
ncbi:MAG: hypothetical protein JWR89_1775 [Tardiphaga sp.]|nr:hypothetical protein [Tardiphaga sp.]